MKKIYSVLIIDDHQMVIENFKNALSFVEKELKDVEFKIEEAKDCKSAFDKINLVSNNRHFNLFILDISLPPSPTQKLLSGEDLGIEITKTFPDAKIIVCTGFNDNLRVSNILKTIEPNSLILKSDIDFKNMIAAIKSVLNDKLYYSKTVIDLLKKHFSNTFVLDTIDTQLLTELSNGAKMKELIQFLPLSKSGIEKRKLLLRQKLNVKSNSDRDLVLTAKEKGFI